MDVSVLLVFLGLIPLIGLVWLWLAALMDVIRTDIANSTDKLIWVCLIVFSSVLGSILWFAWGKGSVQARN
ncbi:PLDc N-terminal domain-containing protein [Jonesiaceae bacterium BS-20]|uniref:PLDc N-terminal domain-containing protein n=1 Tax=Jonesiaceae bacterium BS-20 TaxID=3120821 RepID=A0AAU7E0N9_9MICO